MPSAADLSQSRRDKKNEFYTLYRDIEKEMQCYEPHFDGAKVYSNCDGEESNFVKYFLDNGDRLGLNEYTHCFSDFRSEESVALLKEADIVVTNPPFSLFREYMSQLFEYDKKFIILGNLNAITQKGIFSKIRDGSVWWGPGITGGDREFRVPDDYPLEASGTRVDADGTRYIRVKGVRWFTNLGERVPKPDFPLTAEYTPYNYPKYDNYDAINVDKTKDIPYDYDEVMGVPITFFDKYSPAQFELLGISSSFDDSPEVEEIRVAGQSRGRGIVNGDTKYARFFIRRVR